MAWVWVLVFCFCSGGAGGGGFRAKRPQGSNLLKGFFGGSRASLAFRDLD